MKLSDLGHADVIGVLVGIVGIVLAWVFYVGSKEQVRPCIVMERSTLIGKSTRLFPESVEIRYNTKTIPELSKIRITLWNAGKKTLNEADIAKADPIVIRFPETGVQVLDIRSLTTTRDVVNAKASLNDNAIYLTFDFLDKNDGLALEAFYDRGSDTKITLSGTIKGVRDGIAVRMSEDFVMNTGTVTPGSGFRFLGVASLFIPLFVIANIPPFGHWKINVPDIVVSTVFGVIGISLLTFGTYRYLRGRIPRALRRSPEAVESPEVDKQTQGQRQS
jgi:hypothetical protein